MILEIVPTCNLPLLNSVFDRFRNCLPFFDTLLDWDLENFRRPVFVIIPMSIFLNPEPIRNILYCKKYQQDAPIFGNFLGAATIQERPLLARVR